MFVDRQSTHDGTSNSPFKGSIASEANRDNAPKSERLGQDAWIIAENVIQITKIGDQKPRTYLLNKNRTPFLKKN